MVDNITYLASSSYINIEATKYENNHKNINDKNVIKNEILRIYERTFLFLSLQIGNLLD